MKANFILTISALLLGISAAFTNFEAKNNYYPDWKFQKDKIDGIRVKYVSANHLAGMLRKKEQGIIIMDVRDIQDYSSYHIPGAVSFDPLIMADARQKGEMVILYGATQDSNTEVLQDIPGKGVFLLKGGLEDWYNIVLFPDLGVLNIRNRDVLERVISTSSYFGGKPVNMESLNLETRSSRFREGC